MTILHDTSILLVKEIGEVCECIVLILELQQMMFVAGETGEPSSETTTLIEQIVHEQVLEMVRFFIVGGSKADVKIAQKVHSPCHSARFPCNHHS